MQAIKKYGWHLVIYFLRALFRAVTRKNSTNGRSVTGTYLGSLRALVRSFSSVIDFLIIVSGFDNCLREFQIKGLILAGNTNKDSYSGLLIIPPLPSLLPPFHLEIHWNKGSPPSYLPPTPPIIQGTLC